MKTKIANFFFDNLSSIVFIWSLFWAIFCGRMIIEDMQWKEKCLKQESIAVRSGFEIYCLKVIK